MNNANTDRPAAAGRGRFRHNKRRNTAFLYEALIVELSKAVISKDEEKKVKLTSLIREFFQKGSVLRDELKLYQELDIKEPLSEKTAEKLVEEIKKMWSNLIDPKKAFEAQTKLINQINTVEPAIFNNFVPNYRSLATIAQLFNKNIPIRSKVLLEQKIIAGLTKSSIAEQQEQQPDMVPLDKLVLHSYIKRFNEKYKDLFEEQKQLVNKYILASEGEKAVEFKMFLNEELHRLKETLRSCLETSAELREDEQMGKAAKDVIVLLEGFSKATAAANMPEVVSAMLKTQKLVRELQTA